MQLANVNYLAVIIAAVAGFAIGAAWYSKLFARPWLDAVGLTEEEIRERGSPMPFVVAIIAYLVMAWVLALILGSLAARPATIAGGMLLGGLAWLGFTVTTIAVNNMFAGRRITLTGIDGGHWAVVLVVMGAIIGAFG